MRRRQPGPDLEELPDSRVGGQVADAADQEAPGGISVFAELFYGPIAAPPENCRNAIWPASRTCHAPG